MTLGNYTPFRAKHIDGIRFGDTAWTEANMDSTTSALDVEFLANNAANLLNLTGSADTENPTISYAFAKDFNTSGNEISSSEEALLGADDQGSQNSEIAYGNNSNIVTEFTCVYRNPNVSGIFNSTTKACLIEMDNSESSTTGKVNVGFNNIVMIHVGSLTRNSDGLMEQKVKFTCRGGTSGSEITVSATEVWSRYRCGVDYAEEIRTA